MNALRFFKTQIFKRRANELDAWEDVDELKTALSANPLAGDVLRNGGGLRKIRMPLRSQGKGARGGARVIYYQATSEGFVIFVYMYAKNEAADLDSDEVKTLIEIRDSAVLNVRKAVKNEKRHS